LDVDSVEEEVGTEVSGGDKGAKRHASVLRREQHGQGDLNTACGAHGCAVLNGGFGVFSQRS
jgi:hypothetical protein